LLIANQQSAISNQQSHDQMRHTKIIATIGPASDSDTVLDALIAAGTNIFRQNFSHGTHETHRVTCARIRAAARRSRTEVAVLQDLSGPKIRTGALDGHQPIALTAGEGLRIVTGNAVGGPGRISTTFEGLALGVHPGDRLLLADGVVELRVESSDGREIQTTVVAGGWIGENKGINAPGVQLSASAITPKDVDDLEFGLALGVDMVAVSFVQCAKDLWEARELMNAAGAADVPLVAKLERPQALDDLPGILSACDAVMVARGDLGLEMPLESVPRAQKEITQSARKQGIPVIVATQVLESMMEEPRPTRAEVNDAANAVDDGVDAIMLAGETAAGAHPVRAVQTLDAIIRDAESSPAFELAALYRRTEHRDHTQALCEAAVMLANRGDAQAIVAVTRGGGTARRLSALRPRAPIFATTDRDETARRLSIYWGVSPVCTDIGENLDAAGAIIGQLLVERGLVRAGSVVVLVNISPDVARPDANYLKIQRL
jgi:pyruvate kinase